MSTVTVTQVVEAPLDDVWRAFTDLSVRVRCLSDVDRVEILTAGPFVAGTTWRETRAMVDGTRVTEEFRVRECRPRECFVVTSPGIGADYRTTYRFQSIDSGRHAGGTTVTVEQEGTPSGPAGRVLEVMFGGLAARTAEGALRQELADLAAASVRNPPGPAAAGAAA
ncbi:MAG TPA: SRPBCC family protein, partial [Pilimelia sp.]|nr:SRPBCC family protein [Pilimelia sp.]